MPLDLFDHELVVALDLFVAGAYDEIFVAAQHVDGGLEGLDAVVVALVTAGLISSQRVTLLALDDGLANGELVGRQQNPRHNTPAVVAGHLHKQAHRFVLLQFLLTVELCKALAEHLAFEWLAGGSEATVLETAGDVWNPLSLIQLLFRHHLLLQGVVALGSSRSWKATALFVAGGLQWLGQRA